MDRPTRAREGLPRSSIAQLISLASGIYVWASAPSRRLVERNPLRLLEVPPNDEKPRMRVALAPEAAALLAALAPEDRLLRDRLLRFGPIGFVPGQNQDDRAPGATSGRRPVVTPL